MSLIGKLAISIPESVTVNPENRTLVVKGPKGELRKTLPKEIGVIFDDKNKEIRD